MLFASRHFMCHERRDLKKIPPYFVSPAYTSGPKF